MGRIFYTLIIILTIEFNVFGQAYYPLPLDSVSWNVEEQACGWDNFGFYSCQCFNDHYAFVGDTIINGDKYSKLYSNNLSNDTTFNFQTSFYRAAIREDSTKKVWLIKPSDTSRVLYYDFALNIGDTFCFDYFHMGCHELISVDSVVLTDGNYRRQLNFENGESWIEGIGSKTGWLEYPWVGTFSWKLLCFNENQIKRFGEGICHCDNKAELFDNIKNDKELNISPNPFTDYATLQIGDEHDIKNMQLILFDIAGRFVKKMQITQSTMTLNRDGLEAGLHLYQLIDNGVPISSGKIIIQ